MSLIGLEISDAGIIAAAGTPAQLLELDGKATSSPGFALPQKNHLLLGKEAESKAQLFPRQILNRFWDQLDTEPLELSGKYASTTGQPVRPSHSNPRVHRYGTLISWAYWDFGVVGFVPEFWGGFGRDDDGDGQVSPLERLRFNQDELGGKGFTEWTSYDHPQLGALEIGGWRRRFTTTNPPVQFLKAELELYVPWMLWLAEISPRVVIRDTQVSRVADELFKVVIEVENEGYLPTNITQRALDSQIAVPVQAMVELRDAELVGGAARIALGHIQGARDTAGADGRHPSRRTVEYVVRKTGRNPQVLFAVVSEKGGTARRTLELR